MLADINKIKGIHPGLILKRVIQNKGITSSELAKSIDIHKQTLSAIINQRRSINPALSIKLSKKLKTEADFFMILQSCYDINKLLELEISKKTPNLAKLRPVLFWDTDINTIDWQKNKYKIIERVMERGNPEEKNEIISFYGITDCESNKKN